MGELIRREVPKAPKEFSGERLTSAVGGQVMIEHYHRYLLAREYCRGKDVLDVASGEGYGSALLAQVANTVTGLEIDEESVTLATDEFSRPNLSFLLADACHMPLEDRCFDVIVSFETLEHLLDQEAFFAELKRVMRPEGLLIISTPDADVYSPMGSQPNPYHVLELKRRDFDLILKRYFHYHSISFQRPLIGSVILSERANANILTFENRGNKTFEANHGLAHAPYLIAFASDTAIVECSNSIFVHRNDLDTDAEVRREAEQERKNAERALQNAELELRRSQTEVSRLAMLERELSTSLHQAESAMHAMRAKVDLLNAMEASTSWRVTSPIRYVGRRMPAVASNGRRLAKIAWWALTFQLPSRLRSLREASDHELRSVSSPPKNVPRPLMTQAQIDNISIETGQNPDVSIIICSFGQRELTLRCLDSISRFPSRALIELILVDDAYEGPEDLSVLSAIPGVRILKNQTNLGYLRSCNAAANISTGRYLYMLNNDTEVHSGAIDALVNLLDTRLDAGMAGSKLLFPDGLLQEAGGIIWSDGSGWNYGRGQSPSRPEFNYTREVDYCSGASLMIRRSVFEELSGYDETFAPAYYEEVDLAFRMRKLGLKVLYEPKSIVTHIEGASHGTDLTQGVKANETRNRTLLVERWSDLLLAEHFENSVHILRARDRGKNRKLILVIDNYTVEPDRDAGSRSILGIMTSLIAWGWIVKFWPVNRVFNFRYASALERLGVEVIDERASTDLSSWLAENGQDLDHVLINRPTHALDLHRALTPKTSAVLSYYGVDLHFARMRRQAKIQDDHALNAEADAMEKIEREIWSKFDQVIYPSADEAAVVREMSPNIHVENIVPFCFDVLPPRERPPSEFSILFVAGFAHPPNVDAALFLVRDILPVLNAHLGSVRLTLVGSNPTDAVLALARQGVMVTGYVSDEELRRQYLSHRVSVVPLRFGAGVKGKVIESLCYGLPIVTTSIGAQGIPGLSEIVPIRDQVTEIVESLEYLLRDESAWLKQSHDQTSFAQEHFSREAMKTSVSRVFNSAQRSAGHNG